MNDKHNLTKEEGDKLLASVIEKDGGRHPIAMMLEAIQMMATQVTPIRHHQDRMDLRRVDMPWSHWMHVIAFLTTTFCPPDEEERAKLLARLRQTL